MKPRTKRKIKSEIRRNKVFLAELVDSSIEAEKRGAEDIKFAEGHLEKLRAEPCFENTLTGKIEDAEEAAFSLIEEVLETLSLATGIDYMRQRTLVEIFGTER